MNNDYKDFVEQLSKLIDDKIQMKLKNITTHRNVIVKRVYNVNDYAKRTVDVVFADNISESTSLKNIPVDIPYPIAEGDVAVLAYWNNSPENGHIVKLITQKSTTGYNADMVDGKHIMVLTQSEYDNILPKDPNTIYFILG